MLPSTKRGHSAVSSSVNIRTYDGFRRRPTSSKLKLSQNYKRRGDAKRFRMEQISGESQSYAWNDGQACIAHRWPGLSFEARQDLMAVDGHSDDDDHTAMHTFPPGEEGMFLTHEGGENELCRELFEDEPQTK